MTFPWTKRACAKALVSFLISTAPVPAIAQDLDALAQRGAILAEADPLSTALRDRLDEPGKRGFDIGMGVAEGQTAHGPGKQARGDALPADEQAGYFKAVEYSITRNGNLAAYRTGTRVALRVPTLANARIAEDDPFYTLGFDIATGLLYDQQGGLGDISQSVNAARVRDTLRGAAQRGFDSSARLNGRNFAASTSKSSGNWLPPGRSDDSTGASDSATDGTGSVDRVGSVPNVVGLAASDAEEVLKKAGYQFSEVTIKGSDPRPPFDVVQGTVPPAGTTLVAGSNVRYQTIEAALLNEIGVLNLKSPFPLRAGVDVDTGRNAVAADGADIVGFETPVVCEANVPYNQVPCRGGDPVLEVKNGASMTRLETGDLRVAKFPDRLVDYPLKSRRYFTACASALARSTNQTFNLYGLFDTYVNGVPYFVQGYICIRTAESHLSVVRFAKQEANGDYQFEYALFPDYPVTKPQGRVRLEADPNAPAAPKRSICEMAKIARDRNSPAAPGLTKKCLDSGGTVPQ